MHIPLKEQRKTWQQEIFSNPLLKGRVIAIKDNAIVCVGDTWQETIMRMKTEQNYSLFKVPKNPDRIRILPFKIKSLKKHLCRICFGV